MRSKAALSREGQPRGDHRRQRDHRLVSPGGAARLGLAALADAGRRSSPACNAFARIGFAEAAQAAFEVGAPAVALDLCSNRSAAQNRRSGSAAPAAEASIIHSVRRVRRCTRPISSRKRADGLVIVDQHAAHERIVYEKLKAAIDKAGVARQILLIPEIVELDEADVERLVEHADGTRRASAWCLKSFGPGAVALRETPALLGEIDGARAGARPCRTHQRLG